MVFAIEKFILNCYLNTNIDQLCLNYQRGGHLNAGTCQINNENSDKILAKIIAQINDDG